MPRRPAAAGHAALMAVAACDWLISMDDGPAQVLASMIGVTLTVVNPAWITVNATTICLFSLDKSWTQVRAGCLGTDEAGLFADDSAGETELASEPPLATRPRGSDSTL